MRVFLSGILVLIALFVLFSGYLVWNNNRSIAPASQDALETTLENAIQWLVKNEDEILASPNPMLWRMVQQAGEISGDGRLQALFSSYKQRYLDGQPNNIWRPLFYPNSWVPVRYEQIATFPYYNWHFIYAFTCDQDLGAVPQIAAQNNPAFCDKHRLKPACVTHQMMGLLLLKRSQCGDPAELADSIKALQKRIRTQLTWDPRVVDVYMQRVLMLVQSGAGNFVKPIWLKQLIDAQQADGGWSTFMPLIPVGGGRSIGFSRLITIATPRPDFHMTAQGVLLLALLNQPG